jgi:nuclear GTP-binding protein
MDRVKPVYLSRTYGIPLPNEDDPSQQWTAEELLDKLARMKGRLLKGGEPDLEGVAKILLSDWVRGRIPFFVSPPDRSEELNKAEAKTLRTEFAKLVVKGKQKAADAEGESRVVGVTQNLGSIMQKNTFVPEDVRPLEEEVGDGPREGNSEDDHTDSEDKEEGEEEEEELTWEDVFAGTKDEAPPKNVQQAVRDDSELPFLARSDCFIQLDSR